MAEVDYLYAEDSTLATNSVQDTWDTECTIASTGFSVSTKYLLVARARAGYDTTATTWETALTDGDGGIFTTDPDAYAWSRYEAVQNSSNTLKDYFFVRSMTTKASSLTGNLGIKYRPRGTSGSAWLDQMSVLALNLTDLGAGNYTENIDDDTGTGLGTAGWTTYASITGLDSGKTYLILGSMTIVIDITGGAQYEVRMTDGSSNVLANLSEEGENTAEQRMHGFMGVLTGQTAVKLEVTEDGTTGDYETGGHSYLIAIDTAAFANFDYTFAATGETINSTDQELEVITDPDTRTSANHLFLGKANYTQAGNEGALSTTVRVGSSYGAGAEVLTGDAATFGSQFWDATDAEQVHVMAVQAFTGGTSNDVFLGGGRETSGSDLTSENEFLAVLNLEKGSGTTNELVSSAGGTSTAASGKVDAIVLIDAHTVPAP